MSEKLLNEGMKKFFEREQSRLDGEEMRNFVDDTSVRLNKIREATNLTRQYQIDYKTAKDAGMPTGPITNRWIRGVTASARKMHIFDKETNTKIFKLSNDFTTNAETQKQYGTTILQLDRLYRNRLSNKTKTMTKAERDKYFANPQSDRDFILSYFEHEKYQEKERSYDDGDAPTEELAPKNERTAAKQDVQKESDEDFRYNSYEEISKKIDEMREKEKAENMLQGAVQKGKVDAPHLDDR